MIADAEAHLRENEAQSEEIQEIFPEEVVQQVVEGQLEGVKDLLQGDLELEPWQNKKYNPDTVTWQGAGMRRKQHFRRTNESLGVCAVDLS